MEWRGEQSSGSEDTADKGSWERRVLSDLVQQTLREQRRQRRWNLVWRFSLLAYLVTLLVVLLPDEPLPGSKGRHTAVVRLSGVIAAGTEASAENVIEGLRNAYADKASAGVILQINSPGGSPVQAGRIYNEIGRLRRAHPEVPLYVVVEDLCASGGYYVAAAAQRIYADQASLVGSIGVLINGFGFVEGMQRLGVERRLITAGENKGFLDPFSPMDEQSRVYARQMVGQIHKQFIAAVKQGRGDRLGDDPALFSGLVWTGQRALELGLVDEIKDVTAVAREVIKADKIVDFTVRDDYLTRIGRKLGSSFAGGIAAAMATWNTPLR